MKLRRFMIVCVCGLVALLAMGSSSLASMTSTNYEIRQDSFGSGGDDTSSSASYLLRDTVGSNASEASTSTNYELTGGYRDQIFDQVATFELFIYDRSTQTGASALSGTTVTVSSVVDFSVGEMIAIIQDEGASQNTAIGKITAISGSDMTVDALVSSPSAPTIDGTGDYVYSLAGSSVNLGTLNSSVVSTGIVAWEVDADVDDGYSVYVFEDEDLSLIDDFAAIADVLDGSVTAGSSEYGARSSDTTLTGSSFDTEDAAISTTMQVVGSRTSFAFDSRDFLTLKASIPSSQVGGSYSHTLSVVYVGDY